MQTYAPRDKASILIKILGLRQGAFVYKVGVSTSLCVCRVGEISQSICLVIMMMGK